MTDKLYYIECGRGGTDWEQWDFNDGSNCTGNLEYAIEQARMQEYHDGRYQYRVVDIHGNVYAQWRTPYEGVTIDPISMQNWLEAIRKDYAIDKDAFQKACELWLFEDV